ncbi:MAG TPA: sigma-70 family RNA polymerase sigma factor [Bryobacteraceae bacterium]|nr:sigma-70 family RNA polymerase sigma factor [Bryobacteraceae bacterium]
MADTTAGFSIETCTEQSAPADPVWLVEGLRMGNDHAYEALISRYQQPVYNLVYRLMDDPADASDVVQEVFLKVFRNVASFRGNSSLKTWIYRIAVNEAHNHRRWFTRHRRKEIGLDGDENGAGGLQDVISDPGRSPYDVAADRETRALVEDALTEVNPVFRAAVILRDIEDMSYEEVAEILQISIGTVKSRILRGREALRKTLAGRLDTLPDLSWKPQRAE